jgi:hypothetical protein
MYSAKIIKKEIVEQYDHVLFEVELTSDVAVTPTRDPKPDKIGKDGKVKKPKEIKPRFPTKTIFLKYKFPVTMETIKADIVARIAAIEEVEAMDVQMNKTLTL